MKRVVRKKGDRLHRQLVWPQVRKNWGCGVGGGPTRGTVRLAISIITHPTPKPTIYYCTVRSFIQNKSNPLKGHPKVPQLPLSVYSLYINNFIQSKIIQLKRRLKGFQKKPYFRILIHICI